jgi:hypothetical protein
MPSARTRLLLAAATFVSGILAGGVVDRVVVGGPAWHELGAEAWAAYSRHADLGNGLVAYPVEAIGGALLIVSAAVSNYFDRGWLPDDGLSPLCGRIFARWLGAHCKSSTNHAGAGRAPIAFRDAAGVRRIFLMGALHSRNDARVDVHCCRLLTCRLGSTSRQFNLIGDLNSARSSIRR